MTVVGMTSHERNFASGRAASVDQWMPLMLFLVVQAVAWTCIPATVYTSPPSNTVELALWARDWFIVNYKHPALPAWLLAWAYTVFGTNLWVSLLLAQFCIGAAYLFVFLLGRDLMGAPAALLGTLLLPAVSHFTIDGLKYNHNTVQLPLWIGFCFGLWRASRTDRLPWWVFTAAIAALGFYAKFTMAMVIAFGALWLVLDVEARSRLNGRTPYIAVLVFLLLLLPLAVAIGATHFGSLAWISRESANRGISGLHFVSRVGRTALIMAVALIAGIAINCIRPRRAMEPQTSLHHRAVLFLVVVGGGPLLLTLAVALVKPSRLEWAAPMYSVLGLLFVALVIRFRPQNARWVQGGLRQAVIALAASLGVLSVHAVAASDDRAAGRIDKTLWPAAQIATRFDQIWRAQTGQSLHIVAGDSWTAGMAGLLSSGHPSLFTDLDPGRSPAITERRLEREGMLVIWVGDASWHPDPTLVADFPHGRESFLAGRATVALNYLLIAPGQWSDGDWERWVEPPQ